jgi:hypothetical protein
VPDILHNSQQRRAEGFQQTVNKGGAADHPDIRRPPDDILTLIHCRSFLSLWKKGSLPDKYGNQYGLDCHLFNAYTIFTEIFQRVFSRNAA